jgi:hypothetical protein
LLRIPTTWFDAKLGGCSNGSTKVSLPYPRLAVTRPIEAPDPHAHTEAPLSPDKAGVGAIPAADVADDVFVVGGPLPGAVAERTPVVAVVPAVLGVDPVLDDRVEQDRVGIVVAAVSEMEA